MRRTNAWAWASACACRKRPCPAAGARVTFSLVAISQSLLNNLARNDTCIESAPATLMELQIREG
jgi:hypothetical protein